MKLCKRGHEQTPENIYTSRKGAKQCRLCRQVNQVNFKAGLTGIKKEVKFTPQPAPLSYRHQMARDILAGKR